MDAIPPSVGSPYTPCICILTVSMATVSAAFCNTGDKRFSVTQRGWRVLPTTTNKRRLSHHQQWHLDFLAPLGFDPVPPQVSVGVWGRGWGGLVGVGLLLLQGDARYLSPGVLLSSKYCSRPSLTCSRLLLLSCSWYYVMLS